MGIDKEKYSFLQGGGEMGKLIRVMDWCKTPLGDPKTWPQPLRTMVSVMLDNPFGMYIAWGKDYTQIYNDGYRPILGATKHPQALGISTKETFSEIWHIIGSMFDGVMKGQAVGFPDFMLPLDRNGYLETCYFDFAYSPIRLENGEVGGVLVTVIETTGKKKAVQDLKESEDRFRNMAEGIDIYIAIGDESSNATYFNKAWVDLTGRPMEDLLKFGWLDLVHPEDKERYLNIYLDAFKKKGLFTGEFRALNNEGEYRWLLAQGQPRFRPDGSFSGYISSCTDITEQKLVELALKESQDELLFAIEAAELGTWDYNPLTNKLSANKRLKEWFGFSENEDLELSDIISVMQEGDKLRVTEAIQQAQQYESGGNYNLEYTIINPVSKKETIIHAKGRAWFNDDKIAYRLNGTLEDITERTLSNRKRREMEQHIRTMVLESPVGICVMDAENLITEIVNDSFLEIAGKPMDDIVGKFYWDSFAEAREYYEAALNNVVKTGIPFFANEEEVTLIRHGKEEIVYVTFVYAPLKDEKGNVIKIAVWVVDNTMQVAARKKIMVSETNLKLMILQAPMAIAILRGSEYRVEIANKYALELWGRTEKQVLNQSIFDSMPELLTQGIKELLDEVVKTGKRFAASELPIQLLRNDIMETVYINFSYEALYDADGGINGVMAIGFDVTPQVEARQKVEESEQNIRALVESAPFPIAVYQGEEMKITLANQSIMEIWGKGFEVVGKSYKELLPELNSQQIFEQVYGVQQTGIPFHAKNQQIILEKNGKLKSHYFNYSFTPLLNASGEVYGVMNTAAEVTELNAAKQKIEESLSEVKLFKFMADTAADPFILMEEDGSFVYLNKMALEKWGYTELEMASLKVPDVDIIYNDKKYRAAFNRARKEIIPPFETLHKNKQGEIYPVEINMGSIQVEDKTLLFAIARDITDRKKAEQDVIDAFQKVEDSEKRFRDVVRQAPLGIVIFRGPDNVVEMANESYLQLIDKTENQFLGKPLFETLPDVKETIEDILADVYKTGNAFYGYEFPVNLNLHGKTEIHYFNFVYHPLKENNITTGIMVVAIEVTATVKAKQIIEENEEKLKLIIDASDLGVWDLNIKTNDFIASERCYTILGFPNAERLAPEDIVKHVHPDDLNLRREAFEKAFEVGTLHYQLRIIWEDQSLHWKEVKGKVFYDANNEPARMLGTVRDITEERNFHQQLLEREEKFRLLADSMPQHIWTADLEGNLNYFNQSILDYSGLNPEQLNNKGWLQIVHPDDRKGNIKEWIKAINTGEDFLFEHRFRKYDGEYRWQLSRAIPQKDADGVIKMWVGTSTDIQDQKTFTNELESMILHRTNELRQKNIDLEKMNKELQSFVYISSHDLQEPLRKIQIFASRVIETEFDALSENGRNYFMRMQKSANRMQNLIQDLIAYSRTNTQEIKFEVVDLHEIIESAKETLSEELEQKNVTIELNNICDVKIIPVQFNQVMLNLLSNSIKFSHVDRPIIIKIDCEIVEGNKLDLESISKEKEYCHIHYTDNGIGFDQQFSRKIFEVFQRLHSREEYTGTGIGLAIVKRIIENHDGIILAKGELNLGATFDIYIPN